MISTCIHFPANAMVLFSSLFCCVYVLPFFIQSLVDGHLGWFHLPAVVNNSARVLPTANQLSYNPLSLELWIFYGRQWTGWYLWSGYHTGSGVGQKASFTLYFFTEWPEQCTSPSLGSVPSLCLGMKAASPQRLCVRMKRNSPVSLWWPWFSSLGSWECIRVWEHVV